MNSKMLNFLAIFLICLRVVDKKLAIVMPPPP